MTTTTTEQRYAIDPSHSTAEFIVRHLMIAKVRGRFTDVSGTIVVPAGSKVPTSVQATLQTRSITTGEKDRDAHLVSPDFFHADEHPELTFRSTAIRGQGDDFEMHGDLTMHGKTVPVILHATYEGESTDPWGNRRIGYEAHGKLNRKDYGLDWNQALETGGVLVGEEVKIELTIEAIAQA